MTKCLSLLRRRAVGSPKECNEDSLCGKPNVNGEYRKAFRTKSYVDICNKAQGKLEKTSTRALLSSTSSNSFLHLTEYLLEPRQEIVIKMAVNMKVHRLLVDYFEASLEACLYCDTILEGIRQTRLAYGRITNIVKLSERVLDGTVTDQSQKAMIYEELASFVLKNNNHHPLSSNPENFREIHEKQTVLLDRLNSKRGKLGRRITIKRVCKKVGEIGLVISQGALLVALLVFAFHSIIGLVAVPYVVGGLFGLMRKRLKFKWVHGERMINKLKKYSSERLYEQIDVAARGVYIVINDLDTMSRMVKRLEDEVEHWREVADICVRNGMGEILRQVVREFRDYQTNFLDQLEELEEHIYLCFLTINRSRRLVIQEIMGNQR